MFRSGTDGVPQAYAKCVQDISTRSGTACLHGQVVGFGALEGFSFRIRPTVVLPIWMPALANLLAILSPCPTSGKTA